MHIKNKRAPRLGHESVIGIKNYDTLAQLLMWQQS